MQVVFFGTPHFAIPTLESLLHHPDINVLTVVTQPDKRRGRGNQLIPSPIKKIALEHHIPVLNPKRIKKDQQALVQLREAQADAFVVVAYGQILSPEILAMPKLGCINVHWSILPKYRGAAPIQWCLFQGETETGITTMLMDEGMDTGAMLLKAYTPIHLLDNADKISEILAHSGADLLIETLLKLQAGKIEPIPQNPEEATYAPLIKKADYILDWNRSALAIHNQVRGFYPHCETTFRGQSLKVLETVPLDLSYWEQLPPKIQQLQQQIEPLTLLKSYPGEVVNTLKNLGPVIQTGEGLLLLLQVQLAGKRIQSGSDFVNGTRLSKGEKL